MVWLGVHMEHAVGWMDRDHFAELCPPALPALCPAAGLIIDARSKGNLARLLNSSCDPNCETQKWHDAGNSEVGSGLCTGG